MSHLSALLRTLVSLDLPLATVMERASRVFCESTLPSHYATLVCGRALTSGDVEICNAGHPSPLVVRESGITALEATGVPSGMFSNEQFSSRVVHLERGASRRCTPGADGRCTRLRAGSRALPRHAGDRRRLDGDGDSAVKELRMTL